MALINCPECGKEVSDQAKSCPHCGYLINQDREIKKKKKNENKNLQSKITATNVLAMLMQIGLIVLMFLKTIIVNEGDKYKNDLGKIIYHNDYYGKRSYSLIKASFTNLTKKLWYRTIPESDEWYGQKYAIKDRFDGAEIGFIILAVLIIIILGFMIFEFVKNRLILNVISGCIAFVIVQIYSILLYLYVSHLFVSVEHTDPLDGYYYAYTYEGKINILGIVFIVGCVATCLVKLLNYWLHHENKTEAIKTISFKKIINIKKQKEGVKTTKR